MKTVDRVMRAYTTKYAVAPEQMEAVLRQLQIIIEGFTSVNLTGQDRAEIPEEALASVSEFPPTPQALDFETVLGDPEQGNARQAPG